MESTKIPSNDTNSADLRLLFENIPSFVLQELPLILCSGGCVFNILLIYYFLKTRKYRSPTFMMLTSLAFTDLLSCNAFILSQVFIYPTMLFPEATYSCSMIMFVAGVGVCSSGYHLVFFAAVRFYQLASPLAARARISPEFILKCCLAIWTVIIILMILYVSYYNVLTSTVDGVTVGVCIFDGDNDIKDLCILILATLMPCTSIVLLHVGKHIVVTCKQGRSLEVQQQQQQRKNTDTRVITIVIVLFFIAWFPALTYSSATHAIFENYRNELDTLYLTLAQFVYFNSVIDPLIYCFALKSVRQDIIKAVCALRLHSSAEGS